ncbi:L-threonylcarbamoyladenylate synthase [Tateyamaria pelophila]|uniref:L-threonylcarbamoyladenylate synthase n=1 Tax=Tateyamaria pelophila TaxID=328415 RepID=UPI001CC190DE|nr:L-threonylcarbamoyladenylate synthase [Tateyamaria pelophila]
MTNLQTMTLAADGDGFATAAGVLAKGGLVAFPTETVYGLGADATHDTAVARVFAAKGRPSFNPLIVHVADLAAARNIAVFDDMALRLAAAFWPGPLTLVLPLRPGHGIAPLVSAGLETIALRVPAHPVAQRLLRTCDLPIAAPSANPSGQISPTTAAHVAAGLTGKVDAILDGGRCDVGLESTIVGGSPLALLRPGGLSVERIETLVGPLAPAGEGITAPGQLASHYAPKATVRLNANAAHPGEALLGFGPMPSDLNLSITGDLTEAAANLFGHLHKLDAMKRPIAVAPIPDVGLGRAINDRLRRAAAPR